ncbi:MULTISPECIES: hypothetical protein [unclassified Streptomyces]|uniref:hypothetical protein n=1 Tax=unclassified Streptomyces TaxID=2593676 RepID=UPI001662117B|nr:MULTISPECIES: hypothetical protein [unclassified Streptomyces]MBD0841725.1 hypothetical protein [Streptomyces sp. TRM68416]
MSSTAGPGLTVRPEEAEALAWVMLAELSGIVPGEDELRSDTPAVPRGEGDR